VVGDESAERIAEASGPASAAHLSVPALPEPLSALTCTAALQLFTYHMALERATNPDGFRLEDPRFARASELVRL
jgi:glucosamine 6-phosphate synthetase-like amidotransferase/phosphosugar isomerase protein